ncbi:FluC/FEX family fluoride channel [Corynebacterium pseudopelargi]|uniref:Fluoride-specific ion channel FluC n=1 Tax=Corynebacterium pseudopelargi TaxID=2080757 RepID=A0A3G6ISH6_9CORY|nr:CrcB family protein [Corynebacterium pseudopelargi]AZA08579.1 Putative fluoride ion transporter CrcB [Corynebacterium pseudopelargi]
MAYGIRIEAKNMSALSVLAIALGGALGGLLRWALSLLGPVRGTLAANTLACALLGACLAIGIDGFWGLFLATGVAGAFSTWSTLAKELGGLIQAAKHASAALTLVLNLLAGALALWAGGAIGAWVL